MALQKINEKEYLQKLKQLALKKSASLKHEQYIIRKKNTMDHLLGKGYEWELVRNVMEKK
jgi:regulatory protein